MPTYADYYNNANGASSVSFSGPVKLVVDSNDNVVEQVLGMDIDHASEAIVEGIRQHRTSESGSNGGGGAPFQNGDAEVPGFSPGGLGQIPSNTIVLVIDTNWLLSHLPLFEQMEQLVPGGSEAPSPVLFILPTVVFRELDGLKKSDAYLRQDDKSLSISSLARKATTFLLECLVQRPDLFRGQSPTETLFNKNELLVQDNDAKILDCCVYHQQRNKVQVGLLSNDKVLCTQAAIQQVPFLQFEPGYKDPLAFLRKLHPDLPPYIQSLKANATAKAAAQPAGRPAGSSMPAPTAPIDRPKTQADLKLQEKLAQLQKIQFPAAPWELLLIINTVTTSLLSPIVYHTLLRAQANSNLEIFAYMLSRNPILRPYTRGGSDMVLDYSEWSINACFRLLDQNWSLCFAGLACRSRGLPVGIGRQTAGPGNTSSVSFPSSTSPSGAPQSQPSSLSTSRWAGRSTPTSSPGKTAGKVAGPGYSNGSGQYGSSSAAFHPSKLPALASALSSSAEEIQRWSSPRWIVVMDDLEVLLCRTGLLDNDEDRRKAVQCFEQWRANVECWKQAVRTQSQQGVDAPM